MRFRYRYTDSFYKKMLNSEFLEVSIFLYLPVSSRRNCLFLNMVDTSKRKDGKEKREAPIPIGSQ